MISSLKVPQKAASPNVGLDPTTLRLRVSCSTDRASRAVIHVLLKVWWLALITASDGGDSTASKILLSV